MFARQRNYPSVPDASRVLGYEESAMDGTMVPQKPLNPVHTGRNDDRPGPADYVPIKRITNRTENIALQFGRGPMRPDPFAPMEGPGPGTYELRPGSVPTPLSPRRLTRVTPRLQGWRGRNRDEDASGSFLSASARFPDPAGAPGPGTYNPKKGSLVMTKSFTTLNTRPGFGSTALRPGQVEWVKRRNAPSYLKNPGPGQYEATKPRARRVTAGMRSSSPRFKTRGPINPGPADYRAEDVISIEAHVDAMVSSRTGVFGSSDPRFKRTSSPRKGDPNRPVDVYDVQRSPGPAHYAMDVAVQAQAIRNSGRLGSPFRSSTDRFRSEDLPRFVRDGETGQPVAYRVPTPGPGTYEVSPSRSPSPSARTRAGRDETGFTSSSIRLEEGKTLDGSKIAPVPAPDSYETRQPIVGSPTRVAGAKIAPFINTQARFNPSETLVPGPGAYAHTATEAMEVQTFNRTFSPPRSPQRLVTNTGRLAGDATVTADAFGFTLAGDK